MLSINLDSETESYLAEIIGKEHITQILHHPPKPPRNKFHGLQLKSSKDDYNPFLLIFSVHFNGLRLLALNFSSRWVFNHLQDLSITSEKLLKKLVYEYWQTLKPRQTIAQRRGGHPNNPLEDAPSNLSLRENRKKVVADYIQDRHQKHNL